MNLVQKLAQNLLLSALHADIKRSQKISLSKKKNLKILKASKSLTIKLESSNLCPPQKQLVPNVVMILHISGKNRQVALKKPLPNSLDVQNANILGAQVDSGLYVFLNLFWRIIKIPNEIMLVNNKVNKCYPNIEFWLKL